MSPHPAEMPMFPQPYWYVPLSLHSKSITPESILESDGINVPSMSNRSYLHSRCGANDRGIPPLKLVGSFIVGNADVIIEVANVFDVCGETNQLRSLYPFRHPSSM